MNGKQSKRLRSAAERQTIGLPNIKYNKIEYHNVRITDFFSGLPKNAYVVDPITLNEKCTRSIYKRLKNEYNRK